MRGKKPKERQRYVLRVNETLVEVTRDVYRHGTSQEEKKDTSLKKCRKMVYAK